MDDFAPEKNLLLEEKSKLKERLALLKKEYKRTVNRLQRSERAERVKTHVKKTIEEQNRWLSQECAAEERALVSADPVFCPSNASEDAEESQSLLQTATSGKERKPSVSFNLHPAIVHPGGRTPPCSGSDNSGQEAEGNQTHQTNPTCRSRLRLNRSSRRVCFSESPSTNVFRISSFAKVLDGQGDTTVQKSPSPVFKKCPTGTASPPLDNTTASYCADDIKPVDMTPQMTVSSGSKLFRLGTADNSPGDVHNTYNTPQTVGLHSDAENPTASKLIQHCAPKGLVEQPLLISNSPDLKEMCNTPCDLSVTPTVTVKLEEEEILRENSTSGTSQTSPPLTVESPKHEVHGDITVKEEDYNPLNSCTLVEGLLFPVEYYVRTTRRISSCQRKVDLDAVISSHLGTARKGTRARSRSNSMSLTTPLTIHDTRSTSQTPPSRLPASNSTGKGARSRRGRGRRSCPTASSSAFKKASVELEFDAATSLTPSGSQSEKENCEMSMTKNDSCNELKSLTDLDDNSKMTSTVKTGESFMIQSNKRAYKPRYQDIASFFVSNSTSDADKELGNIRGSKKTTELTGSPLPLLNDRVSLAHLSHLLNITDFHLPDEDFGILKLEKLKSTSELEPYSPYTPRDGKESNRCDQNDSTTLPSSGSMIVLQHTEKDDLTQMPKTDLMLLEINKDRLTADQPTQNKDKTLASDTEEHLADRLEPPSTRANEPTNALLSSPETKEKLSNSLLKDFFPFNPSPDNIDIHTSGIPKNPPPDIEMLKPVYPIPDSSMGNCEEQVPIPVSELQGEVQGDHKLPEVMVQNLTSSTNIEGGVETNNCIQQNACVPPTSPEESSNIVLFSTSLCSEPLENMNDYGLLSCTARLPCLGMTPAVLSSPYCSKGFVDPTPANEEQGEVPCPVVCGDNEPDFMSLGSMGGTGEAVGTRQGSDALEQGKDAAIEDQCNYVRQPETSPQAKTDDKDGSIHETANRKDNEDMEGGHLHLVSEIQDSGAAGCAVDLCSVWWQFPGSSELCIVSATESSVCIWRPRPEGRWERAHVWSFLEMPVIQILPLCEESNIVCVASGNLEIMEIWSLFSHSEQLGWEKQLVIQGQMKTAHGLSRHRVVTSSRMGDGQVLQLWQLSETGSTVESHTLEPPRDSVLAFSEVDGEKAALVGSTMDNYVVIWNMVTGHLLNKVFVGDHYSDITFLRATSDSGLLFLVVGSLFIKPSEEAGSCIFKLIASNPCEGTSTAIVSYVIPDKPSSRFLEGDVRRQKAAAVLTCGSIALWDLPRSHCTVTLPPTSEAPWCLVRWGHDPSCLLTGRKDGSICIYEYRDCSVNTGR